MAKYKGAVGFGSDGVHYPADGEGLDTSRPLRWDDAAGCFREAVEGEERHNDANHGTDIELEVGGE